jgi:hypothetical protein
MIVGLSDYLIVELIVWVGNLQNNNQTIQPSNHLYLNLSYLYPSKVQFVKPNRKPMQRKKICLLAAVLFSVSISFSQTTKDTSVNITKEYVDSLFASNDTLLKEFEAFVDSLTATKSYFDISTGIGNRLFSLRNNAFNSQQAATNKLTLTPALGYYNRSGIGLSWTSFLVFDGSNTGLAQHAFTPSYDYTKSEKVGFGISYTRYFINSSYSFSATPFQNEIYGYVAAKKGWLQPGLSIGWAKGKYSEEYSKDTVVTRIINGIPRQVSITLRDTIKTTLSDFSLIGSLKHDFEWYEIFGKKDDITFTPMLMLIAGNQKYNVSQTSSFTGTYRPRLYKSLGSFADNGSTGFRLQSAGISLNATYTTGKFYISPQYYFDYYLPNDLSAGDKRTTSVFTVTLGVSL